MSPRMGRPKSDNPKNIDIKVRIDEKTNERLKRYAEKKNLTRTEVVRQGIDRILDSDKWIEVSPLNPDQRSKAKPHVPTPKDW